MSEAPASLIDQRIAIGAAAISADAPSGATPRDSAEFEALETEVRRMETEGPGAVNWRRVIDQSSAIISGRGKDLLVGTWLAYGLCREEKLRGLAVGLGVLKGMIAEHWEGMQPPMARERARVGVLEWLIGRAAPLCEGDLAESDWPAALYAYDTLIEIDTLTGEKLRKEQVAYGDLVRALRPWRDTARRGLQEQAEAQAKAEAAAKAREEAAAAGPAPEAAPALAAATTVAAPASATTTPVGGAAVAIDLSTIDQLPETLRTLAAGLIAKSTADARAYLFARIGSWQRIRQAPPNENGRTGAMPPAEEAASLAAMRAAGQNAEALRLLNDLVWTAPFWLDGHRLTAEILGALGPDHADAQATVAGAMGLLLKRVPTLAELSFGDGKPFADPATRNWIAQNAGAGGGGAAAGEDPLAEALGQARGLLADGKPLDAVEALARLTRGEVSGRVRLVRQIAQARFCLDAGLAAAALPLLDHLEGVLKAQALEDWEPALALQVAEQRFRALTHADAPRLMSEERRRVALEETRLRLARLDLATAIRLFR